MSSVIQTINKFFLLAIFFSCLFFCLFLFGVNSAHAATGDITAIRIAGDTTFNGWVAEIDIAGLGTGGTYDMGFGTNDDPGNPRVAFTVTSPGYDTSGNATTISRTVYGTKFIRQAYPNNATADEASLGGTLTVKVALSEFVYSGDTSITATIASGMYTKSGTSNNSVSALSVTNNSVLAYPKVIGRWAWPGYERVTGDFLVEAVAFHHFAQNAKQLAVMKFIATDQHSHTVTQTVTDMTKTTRTGDANIVQVYAATIPVSTLTQGDIITINFEAYPWVGNSSAVLNTATTSDGFAQPDERLGPLYEINDKSGTYGSVYAVVDDTNGLDTNATTYISTSQSTAESDYGSNSTHSYKSIGRAAGAIKAYNNTNYTRNEPGGGVILLNSGSHVYPGTAPSSSGTMNTWLIIKPMSSVSRTNALIDGGATFSRLNTAKVKLEGINITKSTSGAFFGTQTTDVLWADNNVLNTSSGTTIFYVWNQIYATRNTITRFDQGFSSAGTGTNRGPFPLVRGNSYPTSTVGGDVYAFIGNDNIIPNRFLELGNSQGQQISDNDIVAFNKVLNLTDGPMYNQGATNIASGTAIVQNVFEAKNTANPILNLAANTNQVNTTNNILIWNNTMAGSRQNIAYNAFGSTAYLHTNWSMRGNQWDDFNIKSDTNSSFDTANGGRTGDWSVLYGIANKDNFFRIANFPQEFYGFSSIHLGTPGYVADNSSRGTVTGNGTYSLVATSTGIDLATSTSAFGQLLPYDFLGNSIYGSHDAGAYEYQPPYTMGTHPLATSTTVRTYGDEKWRPRFATTTNGTANLNIALPGTDTTQWLDIEISLWNAGGNYHKTWTETSSTTALTNTVHIVGDLAASSNYIVTLDGVQGTNITGASCTSGVCTSDGSGQITFTYTGSYSTHSFDVSQQSVSAPTITTSAPISVATSTLTLNGSITVTGGENATQSGFAYGTSASLSTVIATSTLGSQSGAASFTSSLTGLTPNTVYYFRAYATNSGGTGYGTIQSTTTIAVSTPTVTTQSVSSITATTVTGNGNITVTGNVNPTVRGFTYGTSLSYGATTTSSGDFSTGAFTGSLSSLTCNTDYHIRAYATNSQGIGYGSDQTFTTSVCEEAESTPTPTPTATPIPSSSSSGGSASVSSQISNLISLGLYPLADSLRNFFIPISTPNIKLEQGFSQTLKAGVVTLDVKKLQTYLNSQGFIVAKKGGGSPGNETNFFGPATKATLIKFQLAHRKEILDPQGLKNATGFFGQGTIDFINSQIK